MAPADRSFIDEPLPPEGRALGEIVGRMVSREAWDFLTIMVGDRPAGRGPRQLRLFHITPNVARAYLETDGLCANACRACLPILDRWNSGAWIAKGRRGSPIESPVEIPPPATGYQLIVESLMRSVILEPGTGRGIGRKLICDLHFYSPATQAPKLPLLVKHDGPIEVIERRDNEPAHYAYIRELAEKAFPGKWRRLQHSRVIAAVQGLQSEAKEPVSDRDMISRACGWKKR
jgi:hypothetical protein